MTQEIDQPYRSKNEYQAAHAQPGEEFYVNIFIDPTMPGYTSGMEVLETLRGNHPGKKFRLDFQHVAIEFQGLLAVGSGADLAQQKKLSRESITNGAAVYYKK